MIKNIIISFIFIILISCTGSSFSIKKDIEREHLIKEKKIHEKEKNEVIYISKLKDIEIPFEKIKKETNANESDLPKKKKKDIKYYWWKERMSRDTGNCPKEGPKEKICFKPAPAN